MRTGILAAGNIVRDCNKLLERFPAKNGLVRCVSMHACPGGGAANVAMNLAVLAPEIPVQVLCRLGKDAAGDELLQAFAAYKNIDTSLVVRAGQTAFADVLTEEGSSVRSFVYFPGANAQLDIADFRAEALSCKIAHIGYALALDALDVWDEEYGSRMARLLCMLRKQGIETSFDVVSEDSERYKTLVPPCFRYADHIFLNEIEAGKTLGLMLRREDGAIDLGAVEQALAQIRAMGAPGRIFIHMPEGASACDCRTGEMLFVESPKLSDAEIAATVGAGDAFAAGALISAHRGETLLQAVQGGIDAARRCLKSPTPVINDEQNRRKAPHRR